MLLPFVLVLFGLISLGLVSSLYALTTTRVPVLRTPGALLDGLRQALAPRPGQLVVDAGAADGRALAALCAEPGVRGRGYELNGPVWLWGSLRLLLAGRAGRVRLRWADFRRAELEQADLVYAYLMPAAMPALGQKCLAELRPGARLASFMWPVPDWTPARVVPLGRRQDPLFIYEIPPGQCADRPADTGQKLDHPPG
ncbi:MAG TPA: hypothetical protein PK668_27665 [Myxococcota bacterium]|nr:hypothetical protein [Myxococcota bacterium]HRY95447.1 hypothetical protein [Myxococcota bacterium]